MRSPNAFVVALRIPCGKILLRTEQWFGLGKRWSVLKVPFLRGILVLLETMFNGIVSLNYSAKIAIDRQKNQKNPDKEVRQIEKKKINMATFISIGISFLFALLLFVFLPHGLTVFIDNHFNLGLLPETFQFHLVDGMIKVLILLIYVSLIGILPEIRKVFQYHGAEHKSISTFESGEELTVENAKRHSVFHPRCGTTFIFFLLFISIIVFSIIFTLIPFGKGFSLIEWHLTAILLKTFLTAPIAGISYEFIKLISRYSKTTWGKILSFPGMLLQKLTTREPNENQLEVALSSIRAVLDLEEKYGLKTAHERLFVCKEVEVNSCTEIRSSNLRLKDFLE